MFRLPVVFSPHFRHDCREVIDHIRNFPAMRTACPLTCRVLFASLSAGGPQDLLVRDHIALKTAVVLIAEYASEPGKHN